MTTDYTNVITFLFHTFEQIQHGFIHQVYSGLSAALHKPLLVCLELYIIIVGVGLVQGWFEMSVVKFASAVLKMVVVYQLAMNWPFFSDFIVDLLVKGSVYIGGKVIAASGLSHGVTLSDLPKQLQNLLLEISQIGFWIWHRSGSFNFMPIFVAIVIWMSGVLVVGMACLQYLISTVMLSLLLSLAPLFFCFYLFSFSESVTRRWLSLCISTSLVIVFVSSVVGFILYLFHYMFDPLYKMKGASMGLEVVIPVMILSLLSLVMLHRAVKSAYIIGSGFFEGGMSATFKSRSRAGRVAASSESNIAASRAGQGAVSDETK